MGRFWNTKVSVVLIVFLVIILEGVLVSHAVIAPTTSSTGSGTNTITVRAKGSAAGNTYAHFTILIDNVKIGEKYTTGTYNDYTFKTSKKPTKILVQFDNDKVISRQDRNLYIESITVNGVKYLPKQMVYDVGKLGGYTVKGTGKVYWNGYIILKVQQATPLKTCSGTSTKSCMITNGQGKQSMTCNTNTGVWGAPYGNCTLQSCNNGYTPSENKCIATGQEPELPPPPAPPNPPGAECPQLTPVSPGWCADGTIQSQPNDANGCPRPPICVTNTLPPPPIPPNPPSSTPDTNIVPPVVPGVPPPLNVVPPPVVDLPKTCTGFSTQECAILNGRGQRSMTCNTSTGTWSAPYGTCIVTNCTSGYQISGNICIALTCSGSQNESCTSTITNAASATRTRTCNLGVWGAPYGNCILQSCNNGYTPNGNTCVQTACTVPLTQACNVSRGACFRTGIQTRTCNAGTPTSWGTCSAVAGNPTSETCNGIDDNCDGLIDNGAPDQTQSCSTADGSGTQTRACGATSWNTCIVEGPGLPPPPPPPAFP